MNEDVWADGQADCRLLSGTYLPTAGKVEGSWRVGEQVVQVFSIFERWATVGWMTGWTDGQAVRLLSVTNLPLVR